ncbi:retrovirus-related Pol polyprotein from transposon 17.6 [Trichonephila clavipes]|nr:retrovirus-related Pol polyprotein from transposon 17.6 [Trichonephila clavipes]
MTPAEEKYSSYELEVLAVVNALKKFRTYLLGNHFKIITDCSAFQKTMDKKDLVTRVARWTLLTKWSPFELLTGVTMRNKEDLYPRNLLMEEMVEELQEQRNQLRQDAKINIQKIQAENKRTYDRKRKKAPRYQKET